MNKCIAITWERHRRTLGLCAGLGIPLFELTFEGNRFARYFVLTGRTASILVKERPDVVLVQNPSLVLAMFALMLRSLLRFKLAVDAHNEAIQPFVHTTWPIPLLAKYVLSKADVTIATNRSLAESIENAGGRSFVLPDKLPDVPFSMSVPPPIASPFRVMVIATYAPDEPIGEVIAAGRLLGGEFQLSITGRDNKLPSEVRNSLPGNIRLTGYLPEDEYWLLMANCHCVLDLSLMPNCLVCGAYEALSLGRPLILSNSAAARELFGPVAVFSGAQPEMIVDALLEVRNRYPELCEALLQTRDDFVANWDRAAGRLRKLLDS